MFSNVAHFDLGGYVSKQNCRTWGTENPHAPKTSHCLVRILVDNWAILLRMSKETPLQLMATVIGPC